MKIIINESQYNRLFNKKRTKLVLTEEQFNRLILESDMTKVINNIRTGDIIKLTDKSDNKLTFEVIDAFSGKVLMVNKDSGVFKNQIFFFSSADLQSGNLHYKFINKKDVKDIKDIKELSKTIKDWKNSTFKNIKSFNVESKNGNINLNPDTGKIETNSDNENDDSKPKNASDELNHEILTLKNDKKYEFKLLDGSVLTFNVIGRGPNTISFELESVEGGEGERYKELIGNTLEYDGSKNNLNLKDEEKYIFDIKLKRYIGGEEVKPKKDSGDDYDPNFDSDDIEAGNKNIKQKSEDIIIHDIIDFDFVSNDKKSKKDNSDSDEYELDDSEVEKLMNDLIINNPNIKNAIWKKPNWVLDLLGLAKDKGILPAREKLSAFYDKINSAKDFIKFKNNQIGTAEFIDLTIENNRLLKDIKEFEKFKAKVKVPTDGDEKRYLKTRFRNELDSDEKFDSNYFSIKLKNELESTEDYLVYYVTIFYIESNKKNKVRVGEGKLKIKK